MLASSLPPQLVDHLAVAVPRVPADLDRLAGDEASEVLLRALAEGLSLLRGVDTGEADAVLDLVGVEHGQGVAVGDADDAALQDLR